MPKILVVIPAFNEQATLLSVLSDVLKNIPADVLVVNDGSSDSTKDIALKNNVFVVSHVANRGLGAALGTGFEFARKRDYDILVTFDADGQHTSKDALKLIRTIDKGRADVAIGSRLLTKTAMPLDRKVLNYLSDLLTYIFYGVWTTDSQSGLRAFNKEAISEIKIMTDRMEVSSEFFREIKRNHLTFKEVAIQAIYTDYSLSKGQDKKGNWNALSIGVKMLLRLFS
ncbi:MAG: Bifunctional phosphatase/dolichol-phosphate glucosyltransferase [Microgenomates group bacterium GW2011_GWA1_48_10]|nr:MAG: Bifunctional phosphatase/dolichol-phosphate glucosyltransferase [Microgenomates group bacterium GW2011_GWA1_48_10]